MTLAPTAIVFRTGQLGDTIVSLPAISAVRRALPGHRLVLITDTHAQQSGYVSSWDILKSTGWFDSVIFYDPGLTMLAKARNRISMIRQLRGLRPEYVYNLAPARDSWQTIRDHLVFRYLVGARRYYSDRDGEGKHAGGYSITRRKPEWLRLLRVADPDSGTAIDRQFRLQVPDRDRDRAVEILRNLGVPPAARLLAVGAGSKMQAKRWPFGRYAEVGRRLIQAFPDLYLVMLGGNDEREYCDGLVSAWEGRSVNCAGTASVMESAAILERCEAYLGNDTGTMHLAAAVGVPCVAIFSARDYPGRWEPMGMGHTILRHETDCAGCMLEECLVNSNRCLQGVSTVSVFQAAAAVLGSASRPVKGG